jgi:HSP20 family protein
MVSLCVDDNLEIGGSNNMAKTGTQMAPIRGFRGMDPFRDLMDLQRGINELFEGSFGPEREDIALRAWTPAVDVYEDENSFVIKLDLPEVNRDDVKVSLNENTLSISGDRRFENEQKRENYHRVERSYGQFFRSFTLPPNVDTTAIDAKFKDGVLKLTLPKREEAKPKQIEVKVQ